MLGLTKKTYYTRLKQLIDAGLITKSDGAYCYTTFGNLVYETPFGADRRDEEFKADEYG